MSPSSRSDPRSCGVPGWNECRQCSEGVTYAQSICWIRGQLTAARKQRSDPPHFPLQDIRKREREEVAGRITFCDPQCPRWACLAAFPRSPTKRMLISPSETPPDIFVQFSNNWTESLLVWRYWPASVIIFQHMPSMRGRCPNVQHRFEHPFKKRENVNIYSVNTTQFVSF